MLTAKFYLQQTGDGFLEIDREVKGKRKPYMKIESFTSRSGILHIKAGTSKWEPSEQDLNELCEMFLTAAAHPDLSIVTTHSSVKIDWIPLKPGV